MGSPTERSVDELTTDDAFALLSQSDRLGAVVTLNDDGMPVSVTSLAEGLATQKCDAQPTRDDEIKRIRWMLHHHHLPKLAAANVIDYDSANNIVMEGQNFADLVTYLVDALTDDSTLDGETV